MRPALPARSRLVGLAVSTVAVLAALVSSAHAGVIYDATPATMPGNVPSIGFQASAVGEVGDHVIFGGTGRTLTTVTVMMSDWALHSTYPTVGTSSGWTHPITLNIYAVDHTTSTPTAGALLATLTQVASIPWRPEADPTCSNPTSFRWTDGTCFAGLAFNLTFDLTSQRIVLPDEIVFGVAFDTNTYGLHPIGTTGPYSSLNITVPPDQPVSVGADANTNAIFWNSLRASSWADGGLGGLGIFRQDGNRAPRGTIAAKFSVASETVGLTDLSLSAGQLTPAFDPATTSYSTTVGSGVTSLAVSATPSPGATVGVDGGQALGVGSNLVTITVSSGDGTLHRTYSIVVTRPEPAPAPAPPGPVPTPAPTPAPDSSASTSPTPAPAPTAPEKEQARSDATTDLGAPAKQDSTLDLGSALVFVPTPKATDLAAGTPKVTASSVTLDRGGIADATPQKMLAVSCPTTDCTATFAVTLIYRDAKGKLQTVTLKDVSVDVAQGATGLLSLVLPKEARASLLSGNDVKLKLGVSVDSPVGTVGSDTKTYTLKAAKAKKSKKVQKG